MNSTTLWTILSSSKLMPHKLGLLRYEAPSEGLHNKEHIPSDSVPPSRIVKATQSSN